MLPGVPEVKAESMVETEESLGIPAGEVHQRILPNGLTIIVREDRSSPVASIQAWCATGSIHEGRHLGAGLSHILEHMLFKGTETRDAQEVTQAIQDQGGYINAYTSFDRTVYWVETPSDGVEETLDILADAMMNSTLPEDEYVKEQEVIRREFAMGKDDPNRVSTLLLFSTAYAVHPYREPVIGHLDVYNQLTRDQVMDYYRERYVPNNMAFVVVGDVDAEKVMGQLEEFFADYPRQSLEPVFIPEEPKQLARREQHVEFPTELTRLGLAWHIPDISSPDAPALDVLAAVLGQGRSSRLFQEVRERLELVHGISSFAFTPFYPGLFAVRAQCDPENRLPVEEAILEVIATVQEEGISEDELAKAKRQSISDRVGQLTTTRGQAGDLGINWLYTRSLDFTQHYLEQVQEVTVEDVQRVARKYLRPRNLSVASLNPIGSLAEPEAGEILVGERRIERFELSNGLKLLVMEDPRLPLVNMTAVFRGGLLAETPETSGITQLFSDMLLRGAGERTARELAETIESAGGSVSTFAGNNSFGVSLEVLAPDRDLGLELLGDILVSPRLLEEDLDREKSTQIAAIKAEEDQMIARTRNLLRRNLFGEHPYALTTTGSEESVRALTREQLVEFKDHYLTAANGVVAVFGDVKAAEVVEKAEALLGGLPEGEPRFEETDEGANLADSLAVRDYVDRQQAVLMVGFQGPDLHSEDRYVLEVIDQACSEMGSRFANRIREELGLAYFIGSGQLLGLAPGMFFFYVGTDPGRAADVEAEMLDEIGNLARNGLSEEELERAKKKLVGRQQIRNQSNANFAFSSALDELYGLGYDHYHAVPGLVEAITEEDVRRVAAKYFDGQPRVVALVKPEIETPEEDEE